jgi:hypothetical protein
MLRFLPDSWLEALLRPFLLADPSAGIYYEAAAPDWRFFALAVLLVIGVASRRFGVWAQVEHKRLLLALVVLFYVWTFTIGNGRYFLVGLLAVGPLVVLAALGLPGTRWFRWTTVATILLVQAWTLSTMYRPNTWGMAKWRSGPAVPLAASPLREKPAVFLSITGISYSLLVPLFHPQSRWMNLAGQIDMSPRLPEYAKARALLDSGLPMYIVAPGYGDGMDEQRQPNATIWKLIEHTLRQHRLEPAELRCATLASDLLPVADPSTGKAPRQGVFWVCPVRHSAPAADDAAPDDPAQRDPEDDVFDRVEAHCPRYFPPGQAETRRYADHALRYYLSTDMRVFVEKNGEVRIKYYRSVMPSIIGTVQTVRAGQLSFACDKLPGRYEPPWSLQR